MCFKSKNLYNLTNYYVRQVYTGLKAEVPKENQKQAISDLENNLAAMNEIRYKSYLKKVKKAKEKGEKEPELQLFSMPTNENPYLNFNLVDAMFKVMTQADYRAMPSQANQQVIRKVFDDWSGFFSSLKEYRTNPSKFTGRPKMPNYKKKTGRTTCALTNQIVKIEKDCFLKLPQTKEKLLLGKSIQNKGTLQQVRIVPSYGQFVIEVVYKEDSPKALKRTKEQKNTFLFEPKRVMGLDNGVNNLATIVDNVGSQPMLIKGKWLKSVNQNYNKNKAYYTCIIRNGQKPTEGLFSTERLLTIDRKRNNRVMDTLHKASNCVVNIAVGRKIDTIIIGRNVGWKTGVGMRKSDKQNFIQLPHATFIEMIRYKAERLGIQVVDREESYTSKACLISKDEIPTYGEKHSVEFSGCRQTRSFYRVKNSSISIHADVNAAFNIMRKHVPLALEGISRTQFLLSPKAVIV